MSFLLVVGEGAGVNAKASRLQMPRLWNLGLSTRPAHICVTPFALEVVTEVRP